jgi:hypothetical protein
MHDERNQSSSNELTEPDPRFPSGPWVGFWLQRGLTGRQWMRDIHLRFYNDKVEGYGADVIGAFVIHGYYELNRGKVTLYKAYLGSHTVVYSGQNEGDGLWVWGVWEIRNVDRGGFHIWPKGKGDPTQRRLEAQNDAPVEELAVVR